MIFLRRRPSARNLIIPCLAAAALHSSPLLADDWLVLSGFSYHFKQDQRDWREDNPGIGMERESTKYNGLFWAGGYFRNSYDRDTVYAGVRWMPYRVGPVAFGAYALAATGYWSPVLAAPAISIEGKNVALNIVVVPNLPDHSGFIGTQLRFRLH